MTGNSQAHITGAQNGINDSNVEFCFRLASGQAEELSLLRTLVAHVAERARPRVDIESAVLCAHELAVNALRHGHGERRLMVADEQDGMTIAAFDESERGPAAHPEMFRGLGLISLLSRDGWRVRPSEGGGKWVSARLSPVEQESTGDSHLPT